MYLHAAQNQRETGKAAYAIYFSTFYFLKNVVSRRRGIHFYRDYKASSQAPIRDAHFSKSHDDRR